MNKLYTDIHYIRRYVNGELSPKEMFELEHAAQEDEMIMDIMMGVEFEKSHHLPNSIEDIRQRIKERVAQAKSPRTISWIRWSIAASIVLAISFVSYVFLTKQTTSPLDTLAYHTEEDVQHIEPSFVDTAQHPTEQSEENTTPSTPNLVSSTGDTSSRKDNVLAQVRRSVSAKQASTDPPKKIEIIVLNTTQPHKQEEIRIEDPLSRHTLTPPVEEIHIVGKPIQEDSLQLADATIIQALKNQDTQARIARKIHSDSPEQLRAKLNNMKIDPQTSMVLNEVLNQQAREKMSAVEIVENKNLDLNLADQNYTYIANIKSDAGYADKEKKDSNMSESIQTITFGKEIADATSKTAPSIPINGWKAFDNYLGQALSAQGITSGHFQFEFKIDKGGKPQQIRIIYSDNRKSEQALIEILQKGPLWKAGKDASNVKLELKF